MEIDNEPDNTIAWQGAGGTGHINVKEAAIYASWVVAAAQAVHLVRPTLPVGGLDVSGGDWTHLDLGFTKAALAVPTLPANLQLFSGHPCRIGACSFAYRQVPLE